jgi:hypothetical protein
VDAHLAAALNPMEIMNTHPASVILPKKTKAIFDAIVCSSISEAKTVSLGNEMQESSFVITTQLENRGRVAGCRGGRR